MTAWQTLFLSDDEATASCYGKSVRFFMKSGIYTGFSFWHPAKLVTECGGLYGLTYNAETWVFKLKRDEKQGEKWVTMESAELAAKDFYSMFAEKILHIPEHLEPLENVEPLPELIDDD